MGARLQKKQNQKAMGARLRLLIANFALPTSKLQGDTGRYLSDTMSDTMSDTKRY